MGNPSAWLQCLTEGFAPPVLSPLPQPRYRGCAAAITAVQFFVECRELPLALEAAANAEDLLDLGQALAPQGQDGT